MGTNKHHHRRRKKRTATIKQSKRSKVARARTTKGGAIEPSDIMYQDDLVCILRPEVKKGIVIWSFIDEPINMDLCKTGLKTGEQLHKEGIDIGVTIYHPYIFFRAPYFSREIDYTSPETEIASSYGEDWKVGRSTRIFIRVDPDRTSVFSSELRDATKLPRVNFHISDGHILYDITNVPKDQIMPNNDTRYEDLKNKYINSEVKKSEKTLSDYLRIIKANESKTGIDTYNLYTSVREPPSSELYLYDTWPIERHSEILVSIPHLTPDFFVLCKKKMDVMGFLRERFYATQSNKPPPPPPQRRDRSRSRERGRSRSRSRERPKYISYS